MKDPARAFEKRYEEWTDFFGALGEVPYRATQICAWLWKRCVFDPGAMTDFGKGLRETLANTLDFRPPKIVMCERSKDGTRKFLMEMTDGVRIESALIKQGERTTACLSTQAGCPIGCPFCNTGDGGFERNLSAGEIASQFVAMEAHLGRKIDNLVFMGMGEPFLNTEALLEAIRILNHPKMRELGIRHMTVSTAGVVPGIAALAESGLGVRLAVSLHAPDNALRDELVPCNTSWPLEELLSALHEYQRRTKDRVTIEYALFRNKNDSLEHARRLVKLLRGLHAFINLIPANENGGGYERSTPESTLRFQSVLESAGFETAIRMEHGGDIDAACGQLRRRRKEKEEPGSAPHREGRTDVRTKEEPRVSTKGRTKNGRRKTSTGRTEREKPNRQDAGLNARSRAGDEKRPAPKEREGRPPSAGRAQNRDRGPDRTERAPGGTPRRVR